MMQRARNKMPAVEYGKELIMIFAGSVLYTLSMALIDQIAIIPGNMMGIAVVCNTLFGWPTGLVNIIFSVPTIVAGTLVIGKKMLAYTAIAMMSISALIDWWVPILSYTPVNGPLGPVIIGGLVMGAGCGMVMYAGATTGGTTILGRLLLLKFPKINYGSFLMIMDGVIITMGALTMWDIKGFVYSIIFEVVVCKTLDLVLHILRKCFSNRW